MAESLDDKISRIHAMAADDGGTWDHSPNDRAALQAASEILKRLDEHLLKTRKAIRRADTVLDVYPEAIRTRQAEVLLMEIIRGS